MHWPALTCKCSRAMAAGGGGPAGSAAASDGDAAAERPRSGEGEASHAGVSATAHVMACGAGLSSGSICRGWECRMLCCSARLKGVGVAPGAAPSCRTPDGVSQVRCRGPRCGVSAPPSWLTAGRRGRRGVLASPVPWGSDCCRSGNADIRTVSGTESTCSGADASTHCSESRSCCKLWSRVVFRAGGTAVTAVRTAAQAESSDSLF